MAKPRIFTTLPVRAIGDTRLTALEHRCLAVIALHDGMSLVRKDGAGCYAKSATLAKLVRTDVTNFSKAVSRLIKLDYLVREKQQNDARRFTLRVIYGDDDSWRVDQQSPSETPHEIVGEFTNDQSEMVGEFANLPPEIVGEDTNLAPEIVGDDESRNGSFLQDSRPQYISLNEEIDFVETKEINSVETAQRENFAPRDDGISASTIRPVEGLKKDPAEAGCAGGASIDALLRQQVPKFPQLLSTNPGAALAHFENAFAAIGRDGDALDPKERRRWIDLLLAMNEEFADESTGRRALRLYEELCGWGDVVLHIDSLREWARAAIRQIGYGGQKHLSAAAKVPAPYLSRFCNGHGLSEEFLPGLQVACADVVAYRGWEDAA